MTEETNRDVIWPIGLALSVALHMGGLYYITSHAKTPGATEVPTPAISISLTPTKVLESISETGEVETAGGGVLGQGGMSEPQTEETPPEETKPDPEVEKRERAEAEAREKAEAEAKALEEARVKAETEAREKAEADAREKAQAEAREKAETEAKAKALAEAAAAREQAEREAKELAEAKEKAEAEARAKAEAEQRERAEAEAREKAAEDERQKLAEAQRRKVAEEEARERAEEEQERREEAERRKKQRSARAPGSVSSGNSEQPNRSQSGRVSASTGELINYNGSVRSHIARNKPRGRAGTSGKLVYNIRLTESGAVVSVRIVRSSGNPQLDAAALDALRRAAPYPPAPKGTNADQRIFESWFTFQ